MNRALAAKNQAKGDIWAIKVPELDRICPDLED
jgi:hypothetical protein